MADVLIFALPRLKSAGQRAIGPSCKQGSKICMQTSSLVSVERSATVPRHEIVGYGSIEHGDCCLGELKIKTNTQHCGPVHRHGNKAGEINSAGDAEEAYILLTAEISGSVLHWEEKGRIAGDGGIVDACAGQVMV